MTVHRPRHRTAHRLVFTAALAALAFAALAVPATAARAETITGTFRYLDGAVMRPIAHAKVEVWRFSPHVGWFWTWANEAETTTDGDGVLNIEMAWSARGAIYAVRVFATNYAAQVWPNDAAHTVPFYREPGLPGPAVTQVVNARTDVLDFSWDFTEDWAIQHYNIAETVRHGFDYAAAHRAPDQAEEIGMANLQPTSATFNSYYNSPFDTLVIHSDAVMNDRTILHEYGHYLEGHLSTFAPIISTHDGCTATDLLGATINSPEHAWMEGFADYFAGVIIASSPSGTFSSTSSATEMVGCGPTGDGASVENAVAATLWDLFDGPGDLGSMNESFDVIADRDLEVFQILDAELAALGRWPTIHDFHAAWVARGLDHAALDQLLGAVAITPFE